MVPPMAIRRVLAIGVTCLAVCDTLASGGKSVGAPRARRVRVKNGARDRPYDPSKPLRVMSWNVQYCAGTSRHFFYDGGQAVRVPRREVRENVRKIADVIAEAQPDVVLLQEVDRRSLRTGFVDEHRALRRLLPEHTSHASCAYWRVPWVPHPRHEHVGLINMHLTVLSRFSITGASRTQLPLLQESWIRRKFNLRRAVLSVDLACEDGGLLRMLNTHLSAFSRGDGTLDRQVGVIRAMVDSIDADAACKGWLLAGDCNALPPGVPPEKHLSPDEAALYAEQVSPIQPLYETTSPVLPLRALQDQTMAPMWFTYKPFQNTAGDRTIDHAFTSATVRTLDAKVVQTPGWPSDHLPVLFELQPEA